MDSCLAFRLIGFALVHHSGLAIFIIHRRSDVYGLCHHHCDIYSGDDSERNARTCDELLYRDADRSAVAGALGSGAVAQWLAESMARRMRC